MHGKRQDKKYRSLVWLLTGMLLGVFVLQPTSTRALGEGTCKGRWLYFLSAAQLNPYAPVKTGDLFCAQAIWGTRTDGTQGFVSIWDVGTWEELILDSPQRPPPPKPVATPEPTFTPAAITDPPASSSLALSIQELHQHHLAGTLGQLDGSIVLTQGVVVSKSETPEDLPYPWVYGVSLPWAEWDENTEAAILCFSSQEHIGLFEELFVVGVVNFAVYQVAIQDLAPQDDSYAILYPCTFS